MKLVEDKEVDWWIPTSHTSTAVPDAEVASKLKQNGAKVKVGADTVQ